VWSALTFVLGIGVGLKLGVPESSDPRLAVEPRGAAAPPAVVLLQDEAGQKAATDELARRRRVERRSQAERLRQARQSSVANRSAAEQDGLLLSELEPVADETPLPAEPSPPPGWQLLAENGEYSSALTSIDASGGYERAVNVATAEQLMLLVDIARATGHRGRAVDALRRIVNQHGTDPLAPLAAWSLGNMLEKSGDNVGASQAFSMYRALSPDGDFAEDALARQIRAAVETGDAELARRLAREYDQGFANGRRAEEIRRQLARLNAPSLDAVSALEADAGVGDESTDSE
jgi:hypothetical protein